MRSRLRFRSRSFTCFNRWPYHETYQVRTVEYSIIPTPFCDTRCPRYQLSWHRHLDAAAYDEFSYLFSLIKDAGGDLESKSSAPAILPKTKPRPSSDSRGVPAPTIGTPNWTVARTRSGVHRRNAAATTVPSKMLALRGKVSY